MIVLGLHYGHDGSVSVVRDGRLILSVAHERFKREKKTHGVSAEFLRRALAEVGLTTADVDVVALSDWNPKFSFDSIEVTKDGVPVPLTWNSIFGNDYLGFDAKLAGRKGAVPAFNIGHHVSHCAAAYFTSPFRRSHLLSMDSSGGRLAANSFRGGGIEETLHYGECPGAMIGLAYGQVCEFLGLGSQAFKAGSMMGLAAYARPSERIKEKAASLIRGSFFTEEMAYWDWVRNVLWPELSRGISFTSETSDSPKAMQVAADMQYLFEEAILWLLARFPDDGNDNLCVGGGSFLNCNLNTRIVKETRFKNLHLFPACGDDGGSAGAALYVAHHVFHEPRVVYEPQEIAYLGLSRPSRTDGGEAVDLDYVAEALAAGKIVAWLHGRGEVGPRALGNSSILADPRSKTHRATLNDVVKKREWFRPFAPSVLAERSAEWFDFDGPSPFMLHTAKVLQPDLIPAVTHVDGSARMQTVERSMNPLYYDLIRRFSDLTGVPMVLNTSLNGPGEPIVSSVEDAKRFWESAPVDMMVVDGKLYERPGA